MPQGNTVKKLKAERISNTASVLPEIVHKDVWDCPHSSIGVCPWGWRGYSMDCLFYCVSPVRWFYLSSPSASLKIKHILLTLPQHTSLMVYKVWLWETAGFPRIWSAVRVKLLHCQNWDLWMTHGCPGVKALPHSVHTSERWSQCCWWWWRGWLGRGLPCWWNLAFPYSSCCQSYVGNISECSKSSSRQAPCFHQSTAESFMSNSDQAQVTWFSYHGLQADRITIWMIGRPFLNRDKVEWLLLGEKIFF